MPLATGTITGTFLQQDQTPHSGVVELIPSAPVVRDETGKVIVSGRLKVELDNSGSFSVEVLAFDAASDPDQITWTVVPKLTRGALRATEGISIIAGETVDLSRVVVLDPAAPRYAPEVSRADFLALSATFVPVITPEAFGAVGDGSADDTAAVIAACAAASATKRELFAGIYEPGATLQLSNSYYLATLDAPLVMTCNVTGAGVLYAPASFDQACVLLGSAIGGEALRNADVRLPTVRKPNGTAVIRAGSCGVKIQNLTHSKVALSFTAYFETGVWVTALGANAGTFSNEIFIGQIDLCKDSLKLAQSDAGSYVTSNTFNGGGIMQSENGYGGPALRRPGYRHVVLDGTNGGTVAGGFSVQGNTFIGLSIEGPLSEYMFDFICAADNKVIGATRLELGTFGEAVTADAEFNVFHSPNNPLRLAPGDPVVIVADAAPGGVTLKKIYYVYSVNGSGASRNFSITETRDLSGTIVDVTSAGAEVRAIRPPTIRFDNTSGFTRGNEISGYNTYPGPLDIVRVGAAEGPTYPVING